MSHQPDLRHLSGSTKSVSRQCENEGGNEGENEGGNGDENEGGNGDENEGMIENGPQIKTKPLI